MKINENACWLNADLCRSAGGCEKLSMSLKGARDWKLDDTGWLGAYGLRWVAFIQA